MSATADLALLCFEGADALPLAEVVRGFSGRTVALLIGPEGGFSDQEVVQARSYGLTPIDLGPRILRTETAAIIAAGIIQYALGDLGRGR
jgi:16S rRNA (uracil1498-N3)-methyltransferase